jgi:cytochrome c-type biogenesis protein CcmH
MTYRYRNHCWASFAADRHYCFTGLIVLAVLVIPIVTMAVEPGERLPDPAMEARARAISAELRCLVCQNESIDESHADLARDIRALVRRRLTLGDSDAATTQAVVDRYGEFVLLRPPVRPDTWLLWYGPVALMFIGISAIALWLGRPGGRGVPSVPLTTDERRRLASLTREDKA